MDKMDPFALEAEDCEKMLISRMPTYGYEVNGEKKKAKNNESKNIEYLFGTCSSFKLCIQNSVPVF